MTFTIEPMINAGKRHVRLLPDGWTVVTKDHSLSAQWEHTVLVTADGVEVLTLGAAERAGRPEPTRHDGRATTRPTSRASPPLRADAVDWPLLERAAGRAGRGRRSRRRLPRGAAPSGAARNCSALRRRRARRDAGARPRAHFIDALLRAGCGRCTPAPRANDWRWWQSAATAAASCTPAPTSTSWCCCPSGELTEAATASIERFVTFLWDIGLEVGHSVRTVDECAEESARRRRASMTTLIEARLLAGDAGLLFAGDARARSSPEHVWPSQRVLRGQGAEQQASATSRPTTPPTTSSPTSRPAPAACATSRPSPGWPSAISAPTRSTNWSTHGFLTAGELRKLKQAQAFLWKVRFGLHVLTGRREDRLLFDHQIRLAQSFGYEDATYTLAVEQLMQRYYRTVHGRQPAERDAAAAVPRGDPRRRRGRARAAERRASRCATTTSRTVATTCSRARPSAMLELFVLLQQNPRAARRARRHHPRARPRTCG